MPDDLERCRHIVQHLGDVFAQLAHGAAAVRAGAGRLMHFKLRAQMLRSGLRYGVSISFCTAAGRAAAASASSSCSASSSSSSCSISRTIFRGLPELHPLQLGDARFQLRDLQALVLDCAQELPHQGLQRSGFLRQIAGIDLHEGRVANVAPIRARAFCRESNLPRCSLPRSSGRWVRIGARQSIPPEGSQAGRH